MQIQHNTTDLEKYNSLKCFCVSISYHINFVYCTQKNTMNLSRNFTLAEMLRSETATKHNLLSQFNPPDSVIENLRLLSVNVLQPIRDAIGVPISVTSGYRSPELNRIIGGSTRSHHMRGMAADIVGTRTSNRAIVSIIRSIPMLPYAQLIIEFPDKSNNPQWLHISYDENWKHGRQILLASRVNGRVQYSNLTEKELELYG
jgi:zinc D-Ala-D-Ala carboxypeptidase